MGMRAIERLWAASGSKLKKWTIGGVWMDYVEECSSSLTECSRVGVSAEGSYRLCAVGSSLMAPAGATKACGSGWGTTLKSSTVPFARTILPTAIATCFATFLVWKETAESDREFALLPRVTR